jgi:hypothetical protein
MDGGRSTRVLGSVADDVAKGAGLVVFLEEIPHGFEDKRSLLPARPTRGREIVEDPLEEAAGDRPVLNEEFASRLSAAGISARGSGLLFKVLSETNPLRLNPRPGTLKIAWRSDEPIGLMRPYGEGRVVMWNVGKIERLLARAPGIAVPLFSESMFLATGWKAEVRQGEVGRESYIDVGFRVGKTKVTLKAPGEDIYRRLFISSEGTEHPGFLPTKAGFWLMKVEDPTGEPAIYTMAVDAPPSPALAPLDELMTPEEALEALGEADRSRLSPPLCALFLLLVALEALACNLLYRRVSRGR